MSKCTERGGAPRVGTDEPHGKSNTITSKKDPIAHRPSRTSIRCFKVKAPVDVQLSMCLGFSSECRLLRRPLFYPYDNSRVLMCTFEPGQLRATAILQHLGLPLPLWTRSKRHGPAGVTQATALPRPSNHPRPQRLGASLASHSNNSCLPARPFPCSYGGYHSSNDSSSCRRPRRIKISNLKPQPELTTTLISMVHQHLSLPH